MSRNFVSVGGREIFLVKEPLLQLKDLKNIHIIYNIHTLGSGTIRKKIYESVISPDGS